MWLMYIKTRRVSLLKPFKDPVCSIWSIIFCHICKFYVILLLLSYGLHKNSSGYMLIQHYVYSLVLGFPRELMAVDKIWLKYQSNRLHSRLYFTVDHLVSMINMITSLAIACYKLANPMSWYTSETAYRQKKQLFLIS